MTSLAQGCEYTYTSTRVQRLVTEHMQVPTCASKYLPCVTEKDTCICSVTNRCTRVHVVCT